MGKYRDIKLSVTTDASGDGSTTSAESPVSGRLVGVEYALGTFAAGVDVTISITRTPSGTDQTLLTLTNANASAWYYPQVAVHGNTGTALTATAGGDTIKPLCIGLPKMVIAQGGDTKTGTVTLYFACD